MGTDAGRSVRVLPSYHALSQAIIPLPELPPRLDHQDFCAITLEKVSAPLEDELHERLPAVWDDRETHEEARQGLRSLADGMAEEEGLDELADWLKVEGEETLSCFHFPSTHRLRIRTTNGLERVNQEIKRRSRVVRIFPNTESCLRLCTARLKEHHEDRVTGRRYIDMSPLWEAGDAAEDSIPPAA